ncbi:MAG: GNAT family N-acetyltransferase, partial [Dehalococcoidia bacterium]
MREQANSKGESAVRIAPARPQHVAFIHGLVDSYRFKKEGDEISGFLLPLDVTEIRHRVEGGDFFIAEVEGLVAGCVSIVEYDGIAELRSLAVEERYQRHGVGSQLIERCKIEAAKRGYETLYTLTQTPGGEAGALRLAALSVALSLVALAASEFTARRLRARLGT